MKNRILQSSVGYFPTRARLWGRVAFVSLFGFSFLWLGLPTTSGDGTRPRANAQATQTGPSAREEVPKKMAAGEYEVYEEANEGLVGPHGEEVRNFRESWTLWQNAKREYQADGERRFETLKKGPQSHRFEVELSRDLTVMKIVEFSSLLWVADSGPLTCDFLRNEMHCSQGGKSPDPSKDRHVAVEHPYGLLWPISPFSWGGVTKESERDPSHPTRVSLITIEQPSADNPVSVLILVGKLQYLGVENLETAGRIWQAHKFSVKVPFHPRYLVWTTSKGLLLALSVEHAHANWPKEGLRLVRYQSFSDF